MNRNIDLGTFNWDISAIEKQLIENRQQMEIFSATIQANKKALNDEKKEIMELGKQVALMEKFQKSLNQQLKAGQITQDEFNQGMADSNKVISENKAKVQELASAQAAHIKTILEQERAVKELRLESNELNKLLDAGRTEITDSEHAYRNLNKELNALKTESKNLGAQLVQLRKDGKENTDEYKALEAQWKQVSAEADALNSEFKALDKAVGDNQRSVGDYTDSIKKAFSDIPGMIMSGDIKGAMTTMKTGLSDIFNLVKANPWMLVITGVIALAREFWNHNKAVAEANIQVEQLTNSTGDLTNEIRRNATAIADTYGKDFKEAVLEIDSLMKDFGISADEAFRIYNEGLAMGGAANAEFGDSIREYGPLFAQAGYSANDFVNILNAGIDLGIYNDKLPDAIKEAGLSLNEQTKATRDALVNAFGASFTDDLLKKVQSGQTTVKTALEEISKKAKDANLNQQQLAQLTADVFKGAGEDAGGALKIFQAINHAQEIQYENLTDLEKAVVDLAEKNKELADAKDEAFKSDSVMAFQKTVDLVWKEIQIVWYKVVGAVSKFTMDAISGLQLGFMNTRDFINLIPKAFSSVMKGIMADFNQLANIARAVGSVITAAFTFNPDSISKAIDTLMSRVNSFQSQTGLSIKEVGKATANINSTNVKSINTSNTAKAQMQAAENQTSSNGKVTGSVKDAADKAAAEAAKSNSKRVADAQKAANEATKAAEEAAKKQLEILKQNAEIASDVAKNDLAEYILNNNKKLDDDKRLNAERLAEQIKYYEDLQALKLAENQANLEKEIIGKTEQEKEQIRRDYAIRDAEIVAETNAKKAEITKTFNDQQAEDEKLAQAIEFQQRLVDLEAQGAAEWEIKTELARQQREIDLAELEAQRAEDLISIENYEAAKKLIESQSAEARKQIDEAVTQSKIDGFATVFGMARQAFGEQTAVGKAAAIAEATINTYKAATAAYASLAAIPVVGPALGAVAAGLAVAAGIANVRKIAATKDKFYSGGYTGDGGKYQPAGIVHKGEVVWSQEDVAAAGGAAMANALRPTFKGYANGGIVGSNIASVQKSVTKKSLDFDRLADVMRDAVLEGAAAGTHAGSQSGISDLSDNRRIQQGANF